MGRQVREATLMVQVADDQGTMIGKRPYPLPVRDIYHLIKVMVHHQ